MVAENRPRLRRLGIRSRMRVTSLIKPISSIRSASSSTKISRSDRSIKPCPIRSFKRPGQATRMSTPFFRASTCGAWPTPPKITVLRNFRYLP